MDMLIGYRGVVVFLGVLFVILQRTKGSADFSNYASARRSFGPSGSPTCACTAAVTAETNSRRWTPAAPRLGAVRAGESAVLARSRLPCFLY
jgi:hypothetical protein